MNEYLETTYPKGTDTTIFNSLRIENKTRKMYSLYVFVLVFISTKVVSEACDCTKTSLKTVLKDNDSFLIKGKVLNSAEWFTGLNIDFDIEQDYKSNVKDINGIHRKQVVLLSPVIQMHCGISLEVDKCYLISGKLQRETHDIYYRVNSCELLVECGKAWKLKRMEKKVKIYQALAKLSDIVIELMCGTCGSTCYFDLKSTLVITNKESRKLTIRTNKKDKVRVTGGQRIPWNKFKPVKYHEKISPAALKAGYINIDKPGANGQSFHYESKEPFKWIPEDDLWVHGFWFWSWADKAYKVAKFDPKGQWLSVTEKVMYGLKKGNYNEKNPGMTDYHNQGGYFRFINVLSELDQPGEFYVDRKTKMLYIWPLKNAHYAKGDAIEASIIDTCISISKDSANIVLEGFTLQCCRKFGIEAPQVKSITFTALRIQNIGSYGITITGTNLKINQNLIRNTDGGIDIRGGDRKTLTSSKNEVADNILSNFGRVGYVGSDGVNCDGVGAHVHHNIFFQGAYTGIKWALPKKPRLAKLLQSAKKAMRNNAHIIIGGGRDNIVRQNIFNKDVRYTIKVDARGADGKSNTKTMLEKLEKIPYKDNLWANKYPKLAKIMDGNNPGNPVGNVIEGNIFCSIKPGVDGNKFVTEWYKVDGNKNITSDNNFYAPTYGDFDPRCDLNDYAWDTKFPHPVLPKEAKPRYHVGPAAIAEEPLPLGYKTGKEPAPKPCEGKRTIDAFNDNNLYKTLEKLLDEGKYSWFNYVN
ncbi:unnamed protein product [Mytilus edulis]|uniref:Right handed beta helix domain-containing protein n=1 Tax=Mytilus edulis TaxID=6550 RepID=A0A8S3T397_MYTED|nr:unnamed protein product [Mytilus edulis]